MAFSPSDSYSSMQAFLSPHFNGTSEVFIDLAAIHLMLERLTPRNTL
jgi:hypothetical protein